MIIIITGASHTGKTLLAQRMLEGFQYAGESVILVEDNYEETIQLLLG